MYPNIAVIVDPREGQAQKKILKEKVTTISKFVANNKFID